MAFGLSAGAIALIGAGASVAAPIIGGMMGSDAASDGLAAQQAGADRSDAAQRYIYDTNRADNAPTMQRGNSAGNRMSYLMGLDGSGGARAASLTANQLRAQYLPQFTRTGVSAPGFGQGWSGPGGYATFGDVGDGNAKPSDWINTSESQSQIDEAGLQAAIQAQLNRQQSEIDAANAAASSDPAYGSLSRGFSEAAPEFQKFGEAAPEFQKFGEAAPEFQKFGEAAPEFQKFGEAAPEMRKFGEQDWKNDFVAQNGIQFGLDEGRKGIERQQSASGGILNGATLKALSRFGTDYGTKNTAGAEARFQAGQNRDYGQWTDRRGNFNEDQAQGYGRYVDKYNRYNADQDRGYGRYVDKYNRYNADQDRGYGRYVDRRNFHKSDNDTQFNRLAAIQGTGQTATGQVSSAGQNYGNNMSQTAQGMGNARAAAGIAGSNALSGGLQGAYNNYQQNELLKSLRGSGGTGYSGNTGYARGADPLGDMINANGWSRP